MRGADPRVPFVPVLPSEGSRHGAAPQELYPPGISDPETYGHVCAESLTTPSEGYKPPSPGKYEPPDKDPRGVAGREPCGASGRRSPKVSDTVEVSDFYFLVGASFQSQQ